MRLLLEAETRDQRRQRPSRSTAPPDSRSKFPPSHFGMSGPLDHSRLKPWPNWFVIPSNSLNPQAAFDYLAFLSVEGAVTWFESIPDIPTNSQVKLAPPKLLVEKRGEDFAKDATAFFGEQAKIVTPMWDSPVQGFGNDQIRLAMEKIYTKAATPKDALAEAQAASQAELERVLAG